MGLGKVRHGQRPFSLALRLRIIHCTEYRAQYTLDPISCDIGTWRRAFIVISNADPAHGVSDQSHSTADPLWSEPIMPVPGPRGFLTTPQSQDWVCML